MNKSLSSSTDVDTVVNFLQNKMRQFISYPGSYYLKYRYEDGINVFKKDWDNLIILDACRYDTFSQLSSLPGELKKKYSLASATMEWLSKTVGDRQYNDIVYITANPRVNRYEAQFHRLVPVWKTHWDDSLKVVPPEDLVEVATQTLQEYSDKRIIVHFMQPHVPFIGDFGQSQVGIYNGTAKGINTALNNESDDDHIEPYILLEKGKIERDTVMRAYKENVAEVLPHVESLLREFSGKTVVTSDHGEMFGERGWPTPFRIYGHEIRMPARKLREIPWLEYETGDRREIRAEDPEESGHEISEGTIQQHLEALGYK